MVQPCIRFTRLERFGKYVGPPMTGWQQLDNNPATKSIAAPVVVNSTRSTRLERFRKYVGPPMTGWQQLDNNSASVLIATNKSVLMQMHRAAYRRIQPSGSRSCCRTDGRRRGSDQRR